MYYNILNRQKQYLFYILFAILSMLINMGVQRIFEIIFIKIIKADFYLVQIDTIRKITYGLLIQMVVATIIAFVFKYLVDKIFIFKDKTKYLSKTHFVQVFLYGFFAIFTTLIFWSFELTFKYFLNFKNSHYLGAVIGLTIGYTIKFLLDKKYVFANSNN